MILQPIAPHRLFKQSRLRVRPIKNRRPSRASALPHRTHILIDRVGGKQRLILSVRSLVVSDLCPALPRRPKILPFTPYVIRHHHRRRFQNVLRRAVVLLQTHNFRFRKVALKFQNVANVGPTPRVDRLILVADGADVVPVARQQPHQLILRTIRILILIDQQISKSPIVIFPHRRHRLQQPHGFEQQVVEVHRIGLAQLLAILLEDVRNLLRLRIARLQINFLRIEHVILCPRNPREHVARRQLLVVEAQPPHDPLDHLLLIALVVDDKILREPDRRLPRHARRNPQSLNIPPQHAHTKRMKRGNHRLGNAEPADQLFHPLGHLRRGLVSESHRQDRLGHHAHLFD